MRYLLIFSFLALAAAAHAEVKLCGIQEDDLQLKPENNPYVITGDLRIKKRTLWTINPGVVFQIANTPACTADIGIAEAEPNKKKLIAIYVEGSFQCVGKPDKRIVFAPQNPAAGKIAWYGIVFSAANDEYSKLFYADISGAMVGVKIVDCSPTIRNCIIEKNQTGICVSNLSKSKIFNNNIVNNYSTGLLNENATPWIFSNIIMGNLVGLWSDQKSKIEVEYNDFWNNADGHFLSCPPRYGILSNINERKDSCDFQKNIFFDPVLAGSRSHADSLNKDVRVSTDTARADVVNKKLSRVIVKSVSDSGKKAEMLKGPFKPWQLSKYSRLIDAGYPKTNFRDTDGSLNDIGVWGNSEFRFE